ncbi:MAG: hypothetical protein OXT09_10700 [Myxococcales bacterium]|nr:hypothetical protein [Myxococcales bacterium]
MSEEHHRPDVWPDHDQDFKTHDNAASYWLMLLLLPALLAALVLAVVWLL